MFRPAPALKTLFGALVTVALCSCAPDASRPAEDLERVINDPSRSLSVRIAAIRTLAKDPTTTPTLMRLGNRGTYLSWVAVDALGGHARPERRAEVLAYLKPKLDHASSRVAAAALRSYGKVAGSGGVAVIAAAMTRNKKRPDGYGDIINTRAVEALGAIGSGAAVPALAAELDRVKSDKQAWDYEYGSKVVAALAQIDAPAARKAILAYASWIGDNLPEDPLARGYLQDKKVESTNAAKGVTR